MAAERFGTAEQIKIERMAKASTSKKPVSLYPLSFKEAITALLKVAPPKEAEARDELPNGKRSAPSQA